MASFNDSRCDGGAVCSSDPLLFTCTVADTPAPSATREKTRKQAVNAKANCITDTEVLEDLKRQKEEKAAKEREKEARKRKEEEGEAGGEREEETRAREKERR